MEKKKYVCNPETGRAIKVGGATWNSILSSNNANLIKKIMNLQKYNTKKKACASLHAGHTHYPHGKYSSPHKHRRSHSKVGAERCIIAAGQNFLALASTRDRPNAHPKAQTPARAIRSMPRGRAANPTNADAAITGLRRLDFSGGGRTRRS